MSECDPHLSYHPPRPVSRDIDGLQVPHDVPGGGAELALEEFERLLTYFVVVAWAAPVFAIAAVFVLRRRVKRRRRH